MGDSLSYLYTLLPLLSNDQSDGCVAGAARSLKASLSDVITVPLFFSKFDKFRKIEEFV